MELEKYSHQLVLLNDKTNFLEYVIACLIRFCNHDPIQAEQCALITHNNSKCNIKTGSWDNIDNLSQELLSLGLKVTVEEHEGHMY